MGFKVEAYVDGSYNAATGVYGSGLVALVNCKQYTHFSSGNDPAMSAMRNVAGEIVAAVQAVELCKKLPGVEELVIYHDYEGVANWVTGKWRAKNICTQSYVAAMKVDFPIRFVHVKAHTGNYHNEMADQLAKKGAGVT